MGKHLTPEQQSLPPAKRELLKSNEGLNTALFEPYRDFREEAILLLTKKADATSIPYLVLALQDPDAKVSYGAYTLLSKLTKTPPTASSAADYAANQPAATAPLYAWWTDELNGKHLATVAPSPTSGHRP